MLGDVRFTMFAWGLDTFLLGDEFFKRCAWGCGFQGLVCLGTSISAPLLLGVDLLGSVRQGCVWQPNLETFPNFLFRTCCPVAPGGNLPKFEFFKNCSKPII